MSSARNEVRSSSRRVAGTTPIPMTCGSTPAAATPTTRAIGVTPRDAARSAASTTMAAAPSVMPEELPAVTVPPSSLKTGGSRPRATSVASGRMCSSRRTSVSPPLTGTFTATISSSKRPAAAALAARCWLRRAKASCSSRGILYIPARRSAVSPITMSDSGQRKPSWYIPSTAGWSPMR